MKKRIAIIGAGLSGLTLANALSDTADVVVFDKARGLGGRMATRYAKPFGFDHGAQFFTARTHEFKAYLESLIAEGVVAEWVGEVVLLRDAAQPELRPWLEPHYVAVPHMNGLCKSLAERCTVILQTEVAPLAEREVDGWRLVDTDGGELGSFDWVISTAPSVQTARLFAGHLEPGNAIEEAKFQGCFTLMLGFAKPWDHTWIAAKVRESPIEWIAIDSSKPGRDGSVTSLVVHSRNDWAQEHIDEEIARVQSALLGSFAAITGIDGCLADYSAIHRWRYALIAERREQMPYLDEMRGIASTGDWCRESRIEDVWTMAGTLARSLRNLL